MNLSPSIICNCSSKIFSNIYTQLHHFKMVVLACKINSYPVDQINILPISIYLPSLILPDCIKSNIQTSFMHLRYFSKLQVFDYCLSDFLMISYILSRINSRRCFIHLFLSSEKNNK